MKKMTFAIAMTVLALVAVMVLAAAGCSRSSGGTDAAIKPTWIAAQIDGDQVSISTTEMDGGQMVHFRVEQQSGSMVFMAYRFGQETYLRASICPPCRSESFSIVGDILVCNTCGTRFQATTGDGISGACKGYPKADAAFTVADGRMAASMTSLVTAYQNTRTAGRP